MIAAVDTSQIKRSKVIMRLTRCHHKELCLFSKSLMDDVRASIGMLLNVLHGVINITNFVNGSNGFGAIKLC